MFDKSVRLSVNNPVFVNLAFFLGAGVMSIYVAVATVAWVSYMRIVRAEVGSAMRG